MAQVVNVTEAVSGASERRRILSLDGQPEVAGYMLDRLVASSVGLDVPAVAEDGQDE
jgi:hypothetical protein